MKTNSTWSKVRSVIAELLSFIILCVGALTSATGGFKAIPVLISFYPFNLLTWPSALVTFFCCISGLSGFFSFYGGYEEPVLAACYRFVDYVKNKIIALFTNNEEQKDLKPGRSPIDRLKKKLAKRERNRIILYNENKKAHGKLDVNTGTLEKYKSFLQDTIDDKTYMEKYKNYFNPASENKKYYDFYKEILKKIETILTHPKNEKSSAPASCPLPSANHNSNKFIDILSKAYNILIQILSFASITFGCIVVIAMGIITNQGFVIYWGLTQTTMVLFACFLAATLKQICQMAFSASKQHAIFCSTLGVGLTEKQVLIQEIVTLDQLIETQKQVQDTLDKIKVDIQSNPKIQDIRTVKHLLLTSSTFQITHECKADRTRTVTIDLPAQPRPA